MDTSRLREGEEGRGLQGGGTIGGQWGDYIFNLLMRNLSYKKQSYRLSEDVTRLLKEGKERSGLSYNLFFKRLLDGAVPCHDTKEGETVSPDRTHYQTGTGIHDITGSDGLGDEGTTYGDLQDTG